MVLAHNGTFVKTRVQRFGGQVLNTDYRDDARLGLCVWFSYRMVGYVHESRNYVDEAGGI